MSKKRIITVKIVEKRQKMSKNRQKISKIVEKLSLNRQQL